MQHAALITGIGGSMLVMTISLMLMLTIDDASIGQVIGYRSLALINMVKMNGSKLRKTGNLRNEVDPQHPRDQASYGVPRPNFSRSPPGSISSNKK
jgi:hypothetical protein